MLSVPVLLLIFNRPNLTRQSFERIRKVMPRQLFVAADGPRPDHPDDALNCLAARDIIEQVDWECDVKTRFLDQNRGCGYGPAEAISWFFDHVEQGIILEDDCLADPDFFRFCEEMLDRYKTDEQISMVCGTNPALDWRASRSSYVFAHTGMSWGWASWRRAWRHFDYEARQWHTEAGKEGVKHHLNDAALYDFVAQEFDYYFAVTRPDVWDFQWFFTRLHQGTFSIVPTVNLITNVGFDAQSTHTFDAASATAHLPVSGLTWPLRHPIRKQTDRFFDWYIFERFLNPVKRSMGKRVLLKLVKSLATGLGHAV